MQVDGAEFIGPVILQKVTDLPTWTSADEGRLIYVNSTDKLYIGIASGWQEVGSGGGGGGTNLDSTPDNQSGSGITTSLTYGETISIGQVLYMGSSGKLLLAKADAVSTMSSKYWIALEAGVDNDTKSVLESGYFRNDSASTMTIGNKIYLSSVTAGLWTTTEPSSGQFLQVLGIAVGSKTIEFNMSPDFFGVS